VPTLELRPIGLIRSEHRKPEETPIQPVYCPECRGRVEIFPEYADGLTDLEAFSYIILIYWLDRARKVKLKVKPFLEDREHGVFATRAPWRPNPIGLSVVRLLRREGTVIHIGGVDILDKTPLFDIKPYSGRFDCFPDAHNGWQEGIDEAAALRRGRRGYRGGTRQEHPA
jgi:tRNA-Thr(GGU) m(6)t(6)A37 methyltransferase TsaA